MTTTLPRVASLGLAALAAAACGGGGTTTTPVDHDGEARQLYPDLAAIYGGDQGIYRGCGPSGGVCHNAREFPNLETLGSIVDNIDQDCNRLRDRPDTLHDLCERPGDRLQIGGQAIEIAWLEPDAAADPVQPRIWQLVLREPAEQPPGGAELAILRGDEPLYYLGYGMVDAVIDAADPTRVQVTLPDSPPVVDPEDPDLGTYLADILAGAGRTGDPASIQLGDANRNGIYGGELGGRIIRPGDPARSYLLRRLTDPEAGPLMPRANCCFWSKSALRALWCWVEGLDEEGGNALDPIDYDRCGPGPDVALLYPEPGPGCETSGLCPVEVDESGGDGFSALYGDVLVMRCSGGACHDQTPAGGVDFATEAAAFDSLSARVIPGDPDGSLLYQRLSPELCQSPCETMPLGRPPLPPDELDRVRMWIELGAPR
jgi:hypothetical protein